MSRNYIVGAALALAVLVVGAAPSALAQSAREAALERRVGQLESELKAMRREMREILAAVKKSAAAEPAKITKVTKSGNPNVALTLSGQVNRAVLFVDDGTGTNVYHVDNDNSSTRVRVVGRARLDEDFSVGAQGEVEFESNSSATINQLSDEGVGPNNFKERKLEIWLESKRFGKLWLGQGDTASNGTSEIDLSGTGVIGYSAIEDMAGGLLFARSNIVPGSGDVAVSLASPTIGQAFTNMDGLSRDDRIRYDTPRFMGAQLSASHSSGDDSDVALRYAGKFGPVELAAGAAIAHLADNRNQYAGSISALHDSGLNATFAAGVQKRQATISADDPSFWYAKLGYRFDPFAFGATALAADYEENSDILQDGDFGRSYGFFVVQNISKLATELYLGVRNHSYEQNVAKFDDILAVMAGARIKF